jgi:mannose-1-phosphate guanylyltransferase/phosphomannomutase
VKVYPFKTVEAGAIVNSSLVWESRGARNLFSRDGVVGLANVDVTPELATRVAMAYGTTLKKGATVATSRDSSRASRMLKRAVMAGLNAAGINVDDLEVAPVPATRFQVRSQRSQGGITVRLVHDDPQSVVIRFFDDLGIDITETAQRKIERLFYREDFRRVFPGDIGDIGYPPRSIEFYTAALVEAVDLEAVRSRGFKVVVDYSFGSTAFVMPNVLSKLGADVLAVNPYASTQEAMDYDLPARAAELGTLVRSSGAHLGAIIGADGEHLTLVDDEGHVLTDSEALLAFVHLVAATCPDGSKIALPITTSQKAADIAAEHGATVTWTKLSTAALMDAALEPDVHFAGSADGGFVIPRFLPAFDAMAAFATMLELLATTGQPLSKIVGSLPRTCVAQETVATPWEQKGVVMRLLLEQAEGDVVLIDGVKAVTEEGWVLTVPDPEEPVTHIWAEGATDAAARRLAQEQARRVRTMLR